MREKFGPNEEAMISSFYQVSLFCAITKEEVWKKIKINIKCEDKPMLPLNKLRKLYKAELYRRARLVPRVSDEDFKGDQSLDALDAKDDRGPSGSGAPPDDELKRMEQELIEDSAIPDLLKHLEVAHCFTKSPLHNETIATAWHHVGSKLFMEAALLGGNWKQRGDASQALMRHTLAFVAEAYTESMIRTGKFTDFIKYSKKNVLQHDDSKKLVDMRATEDAVSALHAQAYFFTLKALAVQPTMVSKGPTAEKTTYFSTLLTDVTVAVLEDINAGILEPFKRETGTVLPEVFRSVKASTGEPILQVVALFMNTLLEADEYTTKHDGRRYARDAAALQEELLKSDPLHWKKIVESKTTLKLDDIIAPAAVKALKVFPPLQGRQDQ